MTSSIPQAREYTETEIRLNFLKKLALSELTKDHVLPDHYSEVAPQPTSPIHEAEKRSPPDAVEC